MPDLWVPPVFRQGELALSSIQRRVDSVFERILESVILQLRQPAEAAKKSDKKLFKSNKM